MSEENFNLQLFLYAQKKKKESKVSSLWIFRHQGGDEIRDVLTGEYNRYRVELSCIDIYRISETRDPCYPTPVAYCCVPLVQPETRPSPPNARSNERCVCWTSANVSLG